MAKKLAIDGGEAVRTVPVEPWPYFDSEAIEKVAEVLRSGKVNYWTGEEGRKFETEFADYLGVSHAVAVSNGTVALEFPLQALGVGNGDEVVVTPRSFYASVSSVITQGAKPVFADISAVTQNITADTIRAVTTPRTKAIIVVHLAGWPCDMDPIMQLAEEKGLFVIEDCAQAHGASYKGRKVGSIGHVSAFSFCQDKIITTGGEGGMICTNDEALWKKIWSLKDHGKDYDLVYNTEHPPGFRWLHASIGTNGRLTEMQAVLGRHALARLDEEVRQRRANAQFLDECCSSIDALVVQKPTGDFYHSYYKYYVGVDFTKLKPEWDKERILQAFAAEGIPCFSGSCSEIYLEKGIPEEFKPREPMSIAREVGESTIMFLVHPTLSQESLKDTERAINKVFLVASK